MSSPTHMMSMVDPKIIWMETLKQALGAFFWRKNLLN